MSTANMEDVSSIPSLVEKLVNCFIKSSTDRSTEAYRSALDFLIVPQYNTTSRTDEQHVVSNIHKHLLATQSNAIADSFNLLHGRLQNQTVLKHPENILQLLLLLSADKSEQILPAALNRQPPVIGSTHRIRNERPGSAKTDVTFIPDDGRDVRKLYSNSLGKLYSTISSKTHISQTPSWTNSDQDMRAYKERSSSASSSSRSRIASTMSEKELIQEVIYSFQGIEGKLLRKDPTGLGFSITPKYGRDLSSIQRNLVERLSAVGFLHNQLKQHCDESDKQMGLIGQSLISICREELTNYYKLIALLQAQLRGGYEGPADLTLRRMVVWVAEPQRQLQWLAYIAEQCTDTKGGALVTNVHRFIHHGSECAQQVSSKVLTVVCTPLYLMLSKWLLDGKISDPHGEFFIEARCINAVERLWHDKYHVRKPMIPSFITLDQANKILATGKSINFLRQICKDNEELPGRGALINLFNTVKAEALFSSEHTIELHNALESVYRETSARVLNLLKDKYRLMDHLQALRRYLLLGQGDFIRHLLELLNPELCKAAENLYGHTLSCILDSAIRVTTAQYEDEDILRRLNVSLMGSSSGDIGWDVFTLVYITDGPVETIFKPMESTYKSLFSALWRAKRMEYVLGTMRKEQLTSGKVFKNYKELRQVLHAIHILSCEMIHFLHQTQYYFLFEVLECSWAEMQNKVYHAATLDDVILAHKAFLQSVQSGVLVDPQSRDLYCLLHNIFNMVLSLQSIQEAFYQAAQEHIDDSIAFKLKIESHKGFSFDSAESLKNKERMKRFTMFLNHVKMQVKNLSMEYKDVVKRYLKLLASSANMHLQLLSVRLNFNDYYQLI